MGYKISVKLFKNEKNIKKYGELKSAPLLSGHSVEGNTASYAGYP